LKNPGVTLSGLCRIDRESTDTIRSAVNELARAGYIKSLISLPPSLDKPSSEKYHWIA